MANLVGSIGCAYIGCEASQGLHQIISGTCLPFFDFFCKPKKKSLQTCSAKNHVVDLLLSCLEHIGEEKDGPLVCLELFFIKLVLTSNQQQAYFEFDGSTSGITIPRLIKFPSSNDNKIFFLVI